MAAGRSHLAELRRSSGLTQEEVARRVHVSARTVAAWESGATTPRTANERRLAKALGVAVENLEVNR